MYLGMPHRLQQSDTLRDVVTSHFGSSKDLTCALLDLEIQEHTKTLADIAAAIEDCRILLLDELDLMVQAFGVPARRARKTLILSFDGENYAKVCVSRPVHGILMSVVGDSKLSLASCRLFICLLAFCIGGALGGCYALCFALPP